MITGGNATVMVSSMDAAVDFYTQVLGLRLTNRFGGNWATVDAGRGLVIGLHPASPKFPAPGTKGGIMIGLEIDEPIDAVVERLQRRGVRFQSPHGGLIVRSEAGNFAHFTDPDGNEFYFWETVTEQPAEEAPVEARAAR